MPRRREIHRDAHRLATPRVWHDTIAGLERVRRGGVASAAAPEAPLALLSAAARPSGRRSGRRSAATRGLIERARGWCVRAARRTSSSGSSSRPATACSRTSWVRAFHWLPRRGAGAAAGHRRGDRLPRARRGVRPHSFDGPPAPRDRVDRPGAPWRPHRWPRGRDQGAPAATGEAAAQRHRVARAHRRCGATAASGGRGGEPPGLRGALRGTDAGGARLRMEAANLVEATAILEALGADHVRVPRPIPGMVTERALVMEWLPGRVVREAAGGRRGGPRRRGVAAGRRAERDRGDAGARRVPRRHARRQRADRRGGHVLARRPRDRGPTR